MARRASSGVYAEVDRDLLAVKKKGGGESGRGEIVKNGPRGLEAVNGPYCPTVRMASQAFSLI